MKKIVLIFILVFCIFGLCIFKYIHNKQQNILPVYVLECARDNGFVPSYRGYFAIYNDEVKKISELKYEKLIRKNNYKLITSQYYSITAESKSYDSSKWIYTQGQYNEKTYDIDILKSQLKKMNIRYQGDINIGITEFDNYYILEVDNVDNHTILDSKYAIFCDSKMLLVSEDFDLNSIRSIYKYN